jgi:hypothetical protein
MMTIEHNLDRLRGILERYGRERRMDSHTVLQRTVRDFTHRYADKLSAIMPRKGQIRFERLEKLNRRSEGVKVRPSIKAAIIAKYAAAGNQFDTRRKKQGRALSLVRTKRGLKSRLNLQALMVERELNARESGVGYAKFGVRLGDRPAVIGGRQQILSRTELQHTADLSTAVVTFGQPGVMLGEIISKERQQAMMAEALNETVEDKLDYLRQKGIQL